MHFQIAVDGPAGAGKSTIAKKVAAKLGVIYVDTGAMYRAMALYLNRMGVSADDQETISKACENADISIAYEDGKQVVLLAGENVNDYIRTPEVSQMASKSSANPDVRKKLVSLQQELAAKTSVIMDGRDIGSCVLPNADVKIFLTASSRVRATRRYEELIAAGTACDLDEIEKEIIERDERDMTREHSPLVQVWDATLLDSSDMTIDEVVDAIIALVDAKKK